MTVSFRSLPFRNPHSAIKARVHSRRTDMLWSRTDRVWRVPMMIRGRVALHRTLRIVSAAAVFVGSARQLAGAAVADVCITMSGGEAAVAGLQLDLAWDGTCMSADT